MVYLVISFMLLQILPGYFG